MKLKILFLLFLCLVYFAAAEETAPPTATGEKPAPEVSAAPAAVKDGYALLNSVLTLWDNLYPETKGPEEKVQLSGFALVDSRISQLFNDAKASREANLIDHIFFSRYRRLLQIYKLITIPIFKNEVLEPIFRQAFTEFVYGITFEPWMWGEKDAIPKLAAAVREEFVQLQFYLENRQKSEELKKKVGLRVLPPPPAPPDKPKSK